MASTSIGIVADDTVHFLSKYLYARRQRGLGAEESIRYAFDTVGRALWVTSVILILGFAVLIFSDFNLNANMGLLSVIAISLALLTDFCMLPALLLYFDGKKPQMEAAVAREAAA